MPILKFKHIITIYIKTACQFGLLLVLFANLQACNNRSDDSHVLKSLADIKYAQTQRDQQLANRAQLNITGSYSIPKTQQTSGINSGYAETLIFSKNTNVRIVNNIGFFVHNLAGRLKANNAGDPLPLDNPLAFTLDVLKGDVVLNTTGLEEIFNDHIFNYASAPLKELSIQTQEDLIILTGKAKRKGVWIPIKLSATTSVYQARYLILKTQALSLEGNSATELLKIGKINLDELLTIDTPAVKLKGSDIWVDTANLLPPPKINMQIESVKVNKNGVALKLKTLADIEPPTPRVPRDSYIIIRGGDMRLMRLLTLNAELNIVSKQQDELLDFCFYDYRKQVNEGLLNLLKDGNAIVYLENYKHLDN